MEYDKGKAVIARITREWQIRKYWHEARVLTEKGENTEEGEWGRRGKEKKRKGRE